MTLQGPTAPTPPCSTSGLTKADRMANQRLKQAELPFCAILRASSLSQLLRSAASDTRWKSAGRKLSQNFEKELMRDVSEVGGLRCFKCHFCTESRDLDLKIT